MPDLTPVWTLHQEPHRHYKVLLPGAKKPSWQIKGVGRIVSTTTVLDNASQLTGWAASQSTAAGYQVAVDWFGAGPALSTSLLSFGELCALQPEWPDNVRDRAANQGTLAHHYLASKFDVAEPSFAVVDLAYGLRCAIDDFIRDRQPLAIHDQHGARVERCVGNVENGVAGTYDGHLLSNSDDFPDFRRGAHRLDLKSSRTVQPTYFAQVADYERSAVMQGEQPSDWLTILHVDRLGGFKLHSIPVGGAAHVRALRLFDSYLDIHRSTPELAKLLKGD